EASTRKLDVADRVLMHSRSEDAARRYGVAEHHARGLTGGCALRVAVLLVGGHGDERVRRSEIRVQLLDAGLAALLQDGVDVRRRVDSLEHQCTDEVLAARLLAEK